MPWKETSVMDERMKFISRLLSGDKMAGLCREFGVSRVTGHKIWKRYKQDGARGLYDRSRAPHKHPNQLSSEIERLIIRLKKEKPKWGAPFASANSAWNLTRLSVWWIRLGIKLERIRPGNPQENGRHERMHRTLKLEATNKTIGNLLQQQERFDCFKKEFNFERPHQAIEMKCPADIYRKSIRRYKGLEEIVYPGYNKRLMITNCGRVCLDKQKIHISKALANQPVGLKEVDDGIWQVDFMSYTLGFFDKESDKFTPCKDPFGFNVGNIIDYVDRTCLD